MQTIRNYGDRTMAKKRTPNKTARKPAAMPTKERGKKPAKRPPAKPAKGLAKGTTIGAVATGKPSTKPATRSLPKPAHKPAKDTTAATSKPAAEPANGPAKPTTIETAATTNKQATEEAAKPEHTWVVWQDGRGIWVGPLQVFKDSKRLDTIVCDVIDREGHQGAAALHRAIQLAETVRQSYASHMKYWLHYDDAAQKQRIQEWYDRLGDR
jgi:hypothetical protein